MRGLVLKNRSDRNAVKRCGRLRLGQHLVRLLREKSNSTKHRANTHKYKVDNGNNDCQLDEADGEAKNQTHYA